MNRENFEALIESLTFERLLKEMQGFLTSIMSSLAETVSAREAMATEGATSEVAMVTEEVAPKIASFKPSTKVPKSSRSLRPTPTPTKEGLKTKKYKQKVTPSVHTSPRKHPQKEKPTA